MAIIAGPDVARMAYNAGFRGLHLTIAVAIVPPESGMNDHAHALTSREDSRGLWQINVNAHPWGRSINLYNGGICAIAAHRVYREAGSRFTPWSVYLHDTYLQWMDDAARWVRDIGVSPGITGIPKGIPERIPGDWAHLVQLAARNTNTGVHNLRHWGAATVRELR